MAKFDIKIQSILNGMSSTEYLGSKNSYKSALSVDPDIAINGNLKSSGIVVPAAYSKFTGSNIVATTKWMTGNPVDTNLYGVSSDGIFWSYNQALDTFTAIEDTNNGKEKNAGRGQGLIYYNNYIYIASRRDVARYGPLEEDEGPPGFNDSYWQDTLGFNDFDVNTLDTEETYPILRAGRFPNHMMLEHGDGILYICDRFDGYGCLSRIWTNPDKDGGADIIGERDEGAAKNVIDFPQGFAPTCLASFDTYIVIGCIQAIDESHTNADRFTERSAAIFVWDPTDTVSFFRGPIYVPDPLITAMMTINGSVYIWSGSTLGGCRLSVYSGGLFIRELAFIEDGQPPFPGAVDVRDNRITWGSYSTDITDCASVYSYGMMEQSMPKGVHNIARVGTSGGGTTPAVASIKYFRNDLLVGWTENVNASTDLPAGSTGIDKKDATGTYAAVWRSETYNVNSDFVLLELKIPFAKAVAANMQLTPTIYLDDASSSVALEQINNTTASGERRRTYKTPELVNCRGKNNFYLELAWTGTAELPVGLPIEIKIDAGQDTLSV